MKNLNKKAKGEQIFILCMFFVLSFGILCVTGCGGKSCETPRCGKEDIGDGSVIGVSIPGCGGCITPNKGCNSACWPQSCKIVSLSASKAEESAGDELESTLIGCDVRYYGDGCLGCGQQEKSCYNGCIDAEGEKGMKGFFYGSSDDDEKIIGCANGCGGCVGSEGLGAELIQEIEYWTGVN